MALAAAESNQEASASISEGAVPAPGPAREQLVVQLHRQRVPVKGPGGDISYKSVYFGSIFIGAPVPQEFSVVYDSTVVSPGGDRDQITIAFGTGEVTGEFVQDR